jgi:hypothetical protein
VWYFYYASGDQLGIAVTRNNIKDQTCAQNKEKQSLGRLSSLFVQYNKTRGIYIAAWNEIQFHDESSETFWLCKTQRVYK